MVTELERLGPFFTYKQFGNVYLEKDKGESSVGDRNEYWFNKENLKKHEKQVVEISWHCYAMIETLKEYA